MTGLFYVLTIFCVRLRCFIKRGEISMTYVRDMGGKSGNQSVRILDGAE